MATITVKQAGGGDFTNIFDALASIGTVAGAGADDIVEVYDGDYNLERSVNNNMPSGTSWAHPFTLIVATANVATISSFSGYHPIYLDTGGTLYAIIDGFIIDGGDTNVGPGLVTLSAVSYVRVQNCEIKDANLFGGPGVSNNHVYIGISADSHHIEILDNEIHGGISAGHGVYNEGRDNIIQGNEIYEIGGFGIHNYSSVPGNTPDDNTIIENTVYNCGTVRVTAAGILVGIGSGNHCYNNVSYNNLGANLDGGVGISITGDGAQIYNNTVYGNSWYGIEAVASDTASIKNNIAYNNFQNTEFTGATGLTQSNNLVGINPLFTNAGAGDFTLQAGSPAINYGVYVGLPFAGSAPDAGAFEFELPTAATGPVHVGSTLMMGGRFGMR